MKIYTKTGDKGKSGLIGGTRVDKNDVRLEAYGTVDELNAFIGMLSTLDLNSDDISFLHEIQNNLFVIGSFLATDTTKIQIKSESVLSETSILNIESAIDKIEAELPVLSSFILPGGSHESSVSHICRTISRRAERRIVEMISLYVIDNQILIYLNRLSDYFFVLSRKLNSEKGVKEILWKK